MLVRYPFLYFNWLKRTITLFTQQEKHKQMYNIAIRFVVQQLKNSKQLLKKQIPITQQQVN